MLELSVKFLLPVNFICNTRVDNNKFLMNVQTKSEMAAAATKFAMLTNKKNVNVKTDQFNHYIVNFNKLISAIQQ